MAQQNKNHYTTVQDNGILKLRGILAVLPTFINDYFRGIAHTTSISTRIGYAYDLITFFNYLKSINPTLMNVPVQAQDLSELSSIDIEKYLEYLSHYEETDGTIRTNGNDGIARKFSALTRLYTYLYKHQIINANPTDIVDAPKRRKKNIVRMDAGEMAYLLDEIENYGTTLSGQALTYYEKTKCRDITIVIVFLGTGVRISELIGLNIPDIDFRENRLKITRKGGNEDYVYFNSEVEEYLRKYLSTVRENIVPLSSHENALFLSIQRKRISISAVEEMIVKYAKKIIPDKKITPHTLRRSFGTSLYQETGDIGLVSETLGHSSVQTTKDHYAAIEEGRKRKTISDFRLRE